MALRPGDAVGVRYTKWGGGAHWEFPVTFLGDDDLGTWCGAPAGTWLERPGASFASGPLVTMVDLDLDVFLHRDGDLLLDDEDEFDEHRVTLGYPVDVIALARRTADELMTAAAVGHEPFGPAGSRWLARLAASTP